MYRKPVMCLLCALLALLLIPSLRIADATEHEINRTLTIWLIPMEPAKPGPFDLDRFNSEVGEGGWISVLNTTCPIYREQLKAWNPEFAYPNYPIINGQRETLNALRRFAMQNRIHINVRFVWWGQAFQELQSVMSGAGAVPCDGYQVRPDIAQIGSTWNAYFAERKALYAPEKSDEDLRWRGTPEIPHAAIRFTTDVRLIFYWKKTTLEDKPAFELDGSSWDSLLESLKRRAVESKGLKPPMVMPIVLTPNLLHDYVPLVRSGGGKFLLVDEKLADLTSEDALRIPKKLLSGATVTDESKQWHRLVAFPEISHEEAVHQFWEGEYLALIEPASFIIRWRKQIANAGLPKRFGTDHSAKKKASSVKFWDYAGVAAPPSTFIGGSDLIVMSKTIDSMKEAAFELARFLATDHDYAKTLAKLGHLPAQEPDHGVKLLTDSLRSQDDSSPAVNDRQGADVFASVLKSALDRKDEQEYPPFSEWPTVLESQDVLEALQRMWRRMGEGDIAGLHKVAFDTELTINKSINWRVRLGESVKRNWVYLLIVSITIVSLIIAIIIVYAYWKIKTARATHKALKAKNEALAEVHKVRGFASAGLLALGSIHHPQGNPYIDEKALTIVAGLQGWRRGSEDENWEPDYLKKVIWRAIILALELTHRSDLFRKWEQSGNPEARVFLQEEGLLRSDEQEQALQASPESYQDFPLVYFSIDCPDQVKVPTPFMLEQSLVCLIHNAIEASRIDYDYCSGITVRYDSQSDSLSILNEGESLRNNEDVSKDFKELCDTLNSSKNIAEFEQRIDGLLRNSAVIRPGIGLVEAYCIANQCYGGLHIDFYEPEVAIRLDLRRKDSVL